MYLRIFAKKIKRAMINVSVTAEFSQYSIVVCSGTKSREKWAFFFLRSTATQSPYRLSGNSWFPVAAPLRRILDYPEIGGIVNGGENVLDLGVAPLVVGVA